MRSAVKPDLYLFFADGNNTLTLATGSTVGRGLLGPFFIQPPRQRREPFGFEDFPHPGRTQWALAIFESLADLVNGVVLLTQLDDQVASRRLLGLSNLGSVPGKWRR